MPAIAAGFLLFVAFLLGGASREHELRVALVELAALPLLLVATTILIRRREPSRLAIACVGAIVAIPILQLIPLPPAVWSSLPGREQSVLALEVVGEPLGWMPLTLTPDRTWRSLLALIPPIAMFLGVLVVTGQNHLRLFHGLMAITAAAIIVGVVQLASGGNQFYPWRTTDWPSVVGLFANRNHLATLCLISIPVTFAIGSRQLRRAPFALPREFWLSAVLLALIVVALGAIRSRTGVILVGPALAASAVSGWIATGRGWPKPVFLGILASATAALTIVAAFALGPILARFDTAGMREGRFENWPLIMDASANYLPVGSGIGSFDPVFRSVEPLENLLPTFFNQAHNEYLEVWLETGWLGIGALALFAVWFGQRSWAAWRAQPNTERDLQRASSIAIVLVLFHSVVDYPLRTLTLSVVFALCCATLEMAGRRSPSARGRRR